MNLIGLGSPLTENIINLKSNSNLFWTGKNLEISNNFAKNATIATQEGINKIQIDAENIVIKNNIGK